MLTSSDEAQNIHWEKASHVRQMLQSRPDDFFFMHINALKKYLNLPD